MGAPRRAKPPSPTPITPNYTRAPPSSSARACPRIWPHRGGPVPCGAGAERLRARRGLHPGQSSGQGRLARLDRPCSAPTSTHSNAQLPHRGRGDAPLELLLPFKGKRELPGQDGGDPAQLPAHRQPAVPTPRPHLGLSGRDRGCQGTERGRAELPAVGALGAALAHRLHGVARRRTHPRIRRRPLQSPSCPRRPRCCRRSRSLRGGTGWACGTATGPHGWGGEGQQAALTEGAVTIGVVGDVPQEGVGDAAGVSCGTGGDAQLHQWGAATGSTPSTGPCSRWERGSALRLCLQLGARHGQQLTAMDRANAGTYPVKMLGVARKSWKKRERPSQVPKPQLSCVSPGEEKKPNPRTFPSLLFGLT